MYYSLENGKFIENENGLLPGVEWTDGNSNNYRAIMFLPNFHMLQYGNSIEYLYSVEISPVGLTEWFPVDTKTVVISNSNYLDIAIGEQVPEEEAVTDGELNEGYARQLDFFISTVCKGENGTIPPIYFLMIKEITKRENLNPA